MDSTNIYSKVIADYLYDDMTPEERKLFEKDLLIDENLAKEYEFQSKVIKYIESKIVLEEMQSDPNLPEAEKLVDEYFESKASVLGTVQNRIDSNSGRSRKIYWLSAAAAVFIGLLTTVSIIMSDPNDFLYEKYYAPFDEAAFSFRGKENNEIDMKISNGIQMYINQDYDNSFDSFIKLENSYPHDPVINLYVGLNLVALQQYEEAIIQIENYLDSFEVFIPEAKWYLSLCYLKTGELKNAELLLHDLEEYPGKLGEVSKKLKDKIENRLIK
ncbi:MAG: hypothetical protein WD607_05675 [Candidatus Paceibacterota bacterium]